MAASWPDECYEQASAAVSLACLELLTDEDRWIHRRVETIDLLAQELVRRQVTVEFTLPDRLLDDLRIGARGPWCAPIATLTKRPLRNFDLREDDESRPILGASSGGPIAAGLVTAAARLATAPDALESDVARLLETVVGSDRQSAGAAMGQVRSRAQHAPQIAAILADDTSGYFLATFAESYILMALLARPHGRRILKYGYDQQLGSVHGRAGRARRAARRLGWSPLVIDIDVPTAAHAASYHAEVVVPAELRLDALVLDARTERLLSTDIERGVDRASLYAPRVPLATEPLLTTAISAERSGIPTLALVISTVTSLLLLLGASVARLDSPTAGSSVALLLAGSALFAAAVARGHEHRLVRRIFAGPRWLLSIVAIAALAAAASVAFGAEPGLRDVVWYCAFGASALACLSLAVGFARAASLTRRRHDGGAEEDL